MSRQVRHDGAGAFQVRFPFDRALVDRIKTLTHRRWNAAERYWWVPEIDVVELVDLLAPERFRFDEATRRLYRELGGKLPLDDAEAAPESPRLPGLFEDDAPAAEKDYTVSRLNEQVKRVIESAFPRSVWLVGEISGFNRNAHKRHVSFQLVEKEEDGKTVSKLDATLFEQARRAIDGALARAGEPFRIEDEVTVRMRVRVELYVPWGSYRVLVEELDVNYTLGEAARRREEIIRRLTEAGLIGVNSALPMPALPLRVGLVTSIGSDAYNDVLRTLQESGFAFRVVAHGARVQGHATEPSVLNALDALASRADDLDVVLICRGGGSRTDLAWFDSEAVGRAVAEFPLPVVVGIGHEQDHSVLDAVGRRCKTPTAASALLVEIVRDSVDRMETLGLDLLTLAAARIRDERRRGAEWGRRLALSSRGLLERARLELSHRARRTGRGSRARIEAERERLARWIRDIPRAGSVLLGRQQTRVEDHARAIRPRSAGLIDRERERTRTRGRRLQLIDPRRVVERGYAILRLEGGGVLTGADEARAGTRVQAELKRGSLRLLSEGPADGQGGD